MKSFSERNPAKIAAAGLALLIAATVAVLNYDRLPFVNRDKSYSAYFAEAGGLTPGAAVQVSGLRAGRVTAVSLDGPKVLVHFDLAGNIPVGDRTEAAVKTKTLLGAKVLEVTPRGGGRQDGPIPLERTRSAYQLPDALGDLTEAISGLDTGQLSQSLVTLTDTFAGTPPDVKAAANGVSRFADALNKRDEHLRTLLANANKVTAVLAHRSDQIVGLIGDTDSLLLQLRSQSAALDAISGNVSSVVQQIKGTINENRQTLRPALDKLNGVLAMVANRKKEVQESIKRFDIYALSLGETVSSGPFFKAYLANLIPGQFIQPFVDAAFSDLGLDPNVMAPSRLSDPQVGQPATPALPMPYPRTGQGGPPNMNLPDAITGNPGDPRYPYREPLPAPAPGGPPPGPPAPPLPGQESRYPDSSLYQPAPNEVPPPAADVPPVQAGGDR